MMILNEYSGTLDILNLQQINKLYDIMKEALIQESNNSNTIITTPQTSGQIFATFVTTHNGAHPIFATTNSSFPLNKPNKLFVTTKPNKIFRIIKEPNVSNRRKMVKIIYNNEENNIQNNEFEMNEEEKNNIKDETEYIQNNNFSCDNESNEIQEDKFDVDIKNNGEVHELFVPGYSDLENMFK